MDNPKQLPDFFQYAMHILFAAVIGISFETTNDIIIPIEKISEHFVNSGLLILSYSIIITSWIGYYISIQKNPHRGRLGYVRFILDIFTIYIFYYMVNLAKMENNKYQNDFFLFLLPLTYGIYLVWDIVKYYEYRNKNQTKQEKHDKIFRINITFDYLISFIMLAILYNYFAISQIQTNTNWNDYKKLVFIIISGILIYRYRDMKYRNSKPINARRRMMRKNSPKR